MTEALLFAAIGLAAAWAWHLLHHRLESRLPVSVTIDHDHPRPKDIAGYFAEIAARLDERPEKMRVTFNSPRGVSLDLERDGRLIIRVDGQPARKLDLRRRWIADHPVPIPLNGLVLYIDPVDSNRFRVDDHVSFTPPLWIMLPLSLAATAGIILAMPWLIGLAAGLATGLSFPCRRFLTPPLVAHRQS